MNVINDNDNDDESIEENIKESDEGPLSMEGLRNALNETKNGRAPGEHMIPAEILKNLSDTGEAWKLEIMNAVWETRNVPEDYWKKSVICPIYEKVIKQWVEIIEPLH